MKKQINLWKFSLAFLAANISANSTVVWAASEVNSQQARNKMIREQVVMDGLTMRQAYTKHAGALSPRSQAAMEEWLNSFGDQKYPSPQIQTTGKDKDQLKFVSNFGGKAFTITTDAKNPDRININGQNFTVYEAQNLSYVFRKLASTDSSMKPIADQIDQIKNPKPEGLGDLSADEFIRMPKPKKIEYLMLMRELAEAANEVHYLAARQISANEMESTTYAYHPFFEAAMAAASDIVGRACLVAGNISLYERSGQEVKCSPNPAGESFEQMRKFNSQCASGFDTACNPLVYGFDSNGKPHCLVSSDQPKFTLEATKTCNKKSQLTQVIPWHTEDQKKQEELQRKKDMVRILESYALNKSPDKKDLIKGCFSDDKSLVKEACADLFKEQVLSFKEFSDDALDICEKWSLPDQKTACDALRQRALDLATFTEQIKPSNPPLDRKALCDGIGKWDDKTKKCLCPNGKPADNEAGTYTCAYPTKECPGNQKWNDSSNSCVTTLEEVVVTAKKPNNCEKEDGSKKFYCKPALWIGIGIAALVLLWNRGGKKPKTPLSEGGAGESPGNSGGVRTTTTTQKPLSPRGVK